MDTYEWTDNLNLGIEAIDNQHRKILDYINQLAMAVQQQDDSQIEAVLEALVSYALEHFRFEEALMSYAQYKLFVAHQASHQRFEKKINQLREDFKSGQDPTSIALKTRTWLITWLIKHIQHEDFDYVTAVKKRLSVQPEYATALLEQGYSTLH